MLVVAVHPVLEEAIEVGYVTRWLGPYGMGPTILGGSCATCGTLAMGCGARSGASLLGSYTREFTGGIVSSCLL